MNQSVLMEIEEVLDKHVRPQLAIHKGNIQVVRIEEDILYVRMLGQCSNCPSENITVENIVSQEITKRISQISRVSLETGVSDDLIQQAKEILRRREK